MRRDLYVRSFCTHSLGLTTLWSISVCEAVMMRASTLEPEPRSLKIPAEIVVQAHAVEWDCRGVAGRNIPLYGC